MDKQGAPVSLTNGKMSFDRAEGGATPEEMLARFAADITDDGIVLTIQAPVGSLTFTLKTKDRKTIFFFSQLDRTIRAVQRRLEEVEPFLKELPPAYPEVQKGRFVCPLCDGLLPDCDLCDGLKHVSERTLEQWMVDNGRVVGDA